MEIEFDREEYRIIKNELENMKGFKLNEYDVIQILERAYRRTTPNINKINISIKPKLESKVKQYESRKR